MKDKLTVTLPLNAKIGDELTIKFSNDYKVTVGEVDLVYPDRYLKALEDVLDIIHDEIEVGYAKCEDERKVARTTLAFLYYKIQGVRKEHLKND